MNALDMFWECGDYATKSKYVKYVLGKGLLFIYEAVECDDLGIVTVGLSFVAFHLYLTMPAGLFW